MRDGHRKLGACAGFLKLRLNSAGVHTGVNDYQFQAAALARCVRSKEQVHHVVIPKTEPDKDDEVARHHGLVQRAKCRGMRSLASEQLPPRKHRAEIRRFSLENVLPVVKDSFITIGMIEPACAPVQAITVDSIAVV